MLRICQNIPCVQVFRLLWYDVIYRFLQQPNNLYECFRFGKPASRVFPISSGLLPLFSVTSIACRYTFVFFFATTRSIVSLDVLSEHIHEQFVVEHIEILR